MELLSLMVGGAAGAGLASFARSNREHRTEPAGLADLLGWAYLVDDGVVLQKDGSLLAAFRYRGPDMQSATARALAALSRQFNDAMLGFTDGWMFHVDAMRSLAPAYAESRFPSAVPAWIDAERRAQFRSSRPQFISDFTLSVTYLPVAEVYARAARAFISGAPSERDWRGVLHEFRAALSTLANRLGSGLRVERLDSDAIVAHLHRCLTGLPQAVSAPPFGAYINSVVASQELVGGFAPRVGDQHLRLVAITGYPEGLDAHRSPLGRLDFLTTLPFTYRWSSRFIPVGPLTAATLIRKHQQKWFMGRKGVSAFLREMSGGKDLSDRREARNEELFYDAEKSRMAKDAAAALAENSSGRVRFGFATQVIVVANEDDTVADANARMALTALHDHGFTARVETVNALDAFFGTLPGHGYANLRRPLLSTANIVELWPLTSVWPGLDHNPSPYFPDASPPLMHVATDGSTPFRFNLHVGDIGHTLLVGATGAGKSTFVGLVIAQWQRYPTARTFVFDVGYSHWLLARAAGATHYDLSDVAGAGAAVPSSPSALAFQPLADIDHLGERTWAAEWLELMLEMQGVVLTSERRARLARALELVAHEPRPHRTLTEFAVQVQDIEIADALRPYCSGGAVGSLLDGTEASGARSHDDTSRHDEPAAYQVFELKALMELSDTVLAPVLLYLFRRIERCLDGRPTLIVIEELWAPLMRTAFASRIKQYLLTLRKQNAAVLLVAHSLAQLEEIPGKQIIVESCPTRVLLPNPAAESAENARLYHEIGLNEREVAIIASAVPKRDYFVASPLGSRLVTLELGPVALAFLGTPLGMTPDALRSVVDQMIA
ncbi:MAG: hypothetical protein M3081_10910, partial [Gemmatimonadota bacterium]|nr:hypothetical protein [Gemmatimonadota bacterium]